MGWLSAVAIFFIIWWVTLFAVLPIGVRSQAEAGHVEPGTEAGAPVAPRIGFKLLLTTAIAIAVFAVFYFLTVIMGWSVDDLPRIVPDYSSRD
jgi:predicted secreted protein